ncbi:hypothetical protein HYH02_005151 [Chlamydomonas schloesseri]|uniref:Uncharacterized protein n=1 Tax=Chlamydomonas schloesseri TaxID=2026947 RepID=A0A836B7C9_9CHLO|nr:hypothetical protein HYH02_005151 [Chlamydomonas schloesseri]|eukprot:KAG2449618.1 hypothetical protein HYH02_005151 [Chlamydomonas schloesseri]
MGERQLRVTTLLAAVFLAHSAGACEVCVTVLKGIGDLGDSADSCTLLAEFGNEHFNSYSEGGPPIPQATNFACKTHTPTEIYACQTVDRPTATEMAQKFDGDTDTVYFYYFIPFDINEINTCLYPIDHPYNQKGVALTSECFNDGPVVKRPPITACERPPRPDRSSPAYENAPPPGTDEPSPDSPPPPASPPPSPRPVHCPGDRERLTIRLHRWMVGGRRRNDRRST